MYNSSCRTAFGRQSGRGTPMAVHDSTPYRLLRRNATQCWSVPQKRNAKLLPVRKMTVGTWDASFCFTHSQSASVTWRGFSSLRKCSQPCTSRGLKGQHDLIQDARVENKRTCKQRMAFTNQLPTAKGQSQSQAATNSLNLAALAAGSKTCSHLQHGSATRTTHTEEHSCQRCLVSCFAHPCTPHSTVRHTEDHVGGTRAGR